MSQRTQTHPNPFEAAARAEKVAKLSEVVLRENISTALIAELTDDGWEILARQADVNPPGHESRRAVLRHVVAARAEANTDPFDSFPKG